MLVSVVVLINLLIAMMSDTYQRIQVFKTNQKKLNFTSVLYKESTIHTKYFANKFQYLNIIFENKKSSEVS